MWTATPGGASVAENRSRQEEEGVEPEF